jgi:NADH-quinone oxidoreductase subunit K
MALTELYILTGIILFSLGLMIVVMKRNAIVVLMGIELMLNAANINMVAFSNLEPTHTGSVFALFVIMIAAAEVAVGLSIIIQIYRHYSTPILDSFNKMKW